MHSFTLIFIIFFLNLNFFAFRQCLSGDVCIFLNGQSIPGVDSENFQQEVMQVLFSEQRLMQMKVRLDVISILGSCFFVLRLLTL